MVSLFDTMKLILIIFMFLLLVNVSYADFGGRSIPYQRSSNNSLTKTYNETVKEIQGKQQPIIIKNTTNKEKEEERLRNNFEIAKLTNKTLPQYQNFTYDEYKKLLNGETLNKEDIDLELILFFGFGLLILIIIVFFIVYKTGSDL